MDRKERDRRWKMAKSLSRKRYRSDLNKGPKSDEAKAAWVA